MSKTLLLSAGLCLSCWAASAQPAMYTSTINAAGGYGNISGNNYEWSVGEMTLVNTASASNIIVTQGVLQPAQGTGDVSSTKLITDNVHVYPVPATGTVTVQYNFPASGKLYYELTDITGKSILQKEVPVQPGSAQQTIDLEQLSNAVYMLHIRLDATDGRQSMSSFKLEKIN